MSTFIKRSLTGVAFVTIILAGIIIHPFVFVFIFGIILFLTQYEFYKITKLSDCSPQRIVGLVLGSLFFINCFLIANDIIPQSLIILFIPFLLFVFIAELFSKGTDSLKNSAITIAGLIYVTLPFSLLNFIIITKTSGNSNFYPWVLVGVLFIIWTYDSMAYISGSLFGRHKIAANISPLKSWEGFIGGTVFAIIVGIINAVLFQRISMFNWIVITLLTVVFGTIGDFFQSKLKREIGIKDSGNILPGHGGLLDRLDSLLFAIPIVFIWLKLIDKF